MSSERILRGGRVSPERGNRADSYRLDDSFEGDPGAGREAAHRIEAALEEAEHDLVAGDEHCAQVADRRRPAFSKDSAFAHPAIESGELVVRHVRPEALR